jgi:hypothetical protein
MLNVFQKKPAAGQVKALFLHIQKTAGTSIIHLARQYYGGNLTSHGDCWNFQPKQLKHIGFISGHIGYQYAQPLMSNRFSFTFLRDPVERILSMYFFCRSRNPNEFEIYGKAHELDLPRFLEAAQWDSCIRKNIWNNQVWQLAHGYAHQDKRTIDDFSESELLRLAKQHLIQFSHVGFTETFDSDAAAILAALAFPETKQLPKLNDLPNRLRGSELSPAIRSLLDELTVLDRELYLYASEQRTAAKNSEGTP